jgi:hypothetical protein
MRTVVIGACARRRISEPGTRLVRAIQVAVGVLALVILLTVSGGAYLWFRVFRKVPGGAAVAATDARTSGRVTSAAQIRMDVSIEQSSERLTGDRRDFDFNQVKVVIFGADGKAVEQDDIVLLVNGIPLTFSVPTGNYYDRYPQYRLDNDARLSLAPDTEYRFSIAWGTAEPVDAATIRTPKGLGTDNIHIPKAHIEETALPFSWDELGERADLEVYRTMTFTDELGNEGYVSGSPQSEDTMRRTIGPGFMRSASGAFTIPASFFAPTDSGRVATVHVDVTGRSRGTFLLPFLPGGRIEAVRKVTLHVEHEGAG